ncbi:MAG: acetyl-CoA C-acyltransferase, partial [Pseudomonadota bacterium]|nr:acetyl-CoA C-acyltransferase [Pseudomonadota bacterium]
MANRDAVIVSTARTPIGRAYRGAFNATPSPTLAAHAIRAAVERSGVDPAEIEDVIMGAALQQGVQATIGRTAALRAGLPVTVAAMSIDRQCASGLMAIATAAKQVIVDRMDVCVAGGVESISMVQTPEMRLGADPELVAMHKDVYMPMIGTAEVVGKRYNIGRDRQDAYALQSQQRTAAAQEAGRFDAEIIPVTAKMMVKDKATGETSMKDVTLTRDEGNRPETTLEGLTSLQPVMGPDALITAGNASQLSDGASACVIMEAEVAKARGLTPLGRYIGMAVAGTEPEEMGIGPVFAVPKLLER